MLGISLRDRFKNEEIRRWPRVTNITKRISSLMWQWSGHVCSLENWWPFIGAGKLSSRDRGSHKKKNVMRVRQGSKKRLILEYAGVFLFFASSLNSLIDLLINWITLIMQLNNHLLWLKLRSRARPERFTAKTSNGRIAKYLCLFFYLLWFFSNLWWPNAWIVCYF